MSRPGLREALERLNRSTDRASRIAEDPIAFPRRFRDPADIEIVAWLAASLSYGRVPLFSAVLERLLDRMGGRPRAYVERFDPAVELPRLRPLYYRMNKGIDIACLLYLMREVVRAHGSVGALFAQGVGPGDADVGPALESFLSRVLAIDTSPVYGSHQHPHGLAQFFSRPSKGSACKRLNMLLRWMVRPDDGVDFGLWTFLKPSKLIVPLDTHVLRISRYLGLTRRRTGGWQTARAITRRLAEADPADPLKYDFALCHLGISGRCPPASVPACCRACPLLTECAKGRALTRMPSTKPGSTSLKTP